jgi:hypothetical protein
LGVEEKRVFEVHLLRSGDALFVPGLTAVPSSRDKAIPSCDPGGVRIDRGNAGDRREGRGTHVLRDPALSSVRRVENKVVVTRGPAIERVGKGNRV